MNLALFYLRLDLDVCEKVCKKSEAMKCSHGLWLVVDKGKKEVFRNTVIE
jgi:hypothetical protein